MPPSVRAWTERSTYAVGAEVSVHCDVSGNPPPQVNWYKDDQPVVVSERVQITGAYLRLARSSPQRFYPTVGHDPHAFSMVGCDPTDCRRAVIGRLLVHGHFQLFLDRLHECFPNWWVVTPIQGRVPYVAMGTENAVDFFN